MNETFCPDCEGTGFLYVPDYYDYGQVVGRGQLCSLCRGSGLPQEPPSVGGGEGGAGRGKGKGGL